MSKVKLHMRAFMLMLIAFGIDTPLSAQNQSSRFSWELAPKAFLTQYDSRFACELGWGAGLEVSRALRTGWRFGFDGAYQIAAQPLVLFGNAQNVKSDWLRAALTLQKQWRVDKKNRCAVFAEVEGGILVIRQRAVQISGSTFGLIRIDAKSEVKFAPALGVGLRVRVSPRWAVLCSVKNHFVPWVERRLESAATKRVWKSYRHLGAGLGFSF